MKIAVTYDENGQVFQHFGHTEHFKIYEFGDSGLVNTMVIGTNRTGHEAAVVGAADATDRTRGPRG